MMETCQYCQKIIKGDEEIKTFRSEKRKSCHLKCYKNWKNEKKKQKKLILPRILNALFLDGYVYGKSEVSSHREMKLTPDGVCPYCQKIIKGDEEIKTFRSERRKSCHLKCYKRRPHKTWWEWTIGISVVSIILCIIILSILFSK